VTNAPRTTNPADRELEGLVRHVTAADWLVLLIGVLYATATLVDARPVWLAAAAFAVAGITLRVARFPSNARLRIELQAWSMVVFIGYVVWTTGADASPLQSLYLLPVVLAGLVLTPARLAPLVVAIGAISIGAIFADADVPIRSFAFAGRALLAIAPLAIVAWLTSELGGALSSARRRAAALAEGDALTGLAGRRAFIDGLQEEVTMATRRDQPTALLVLDLTGTRRLNELHGQEAGNAALRLVADVLRRVLRQTDRAARMGGDEFAVLLSGADAAAALVAAQRIRHAIYATTLDVGARHVRCTISVGMASVPRDGRDATALLAAAERRLERDRGLRAGTAAAAVPGA
jgi:diguanylate cyclase (GGDEF)-like protein